MPASTAKTRRAQILIGKKDRAIRVSHAGKLTPDDVRRVNDKLIGVVKDLTGCPCMSGIIDVIWERQFDKVLDVQLG